jgi:inner membrane protein
MASAFGHAALGATLGKLILPESRHWPWWVAAAACAVLPDADFIGFKLGVPYASLWGHRGLTHSLMAALLLALLACVVNFTRHPGRRPSNLNVAALIFLATASHGVLDAMTTGGLGVAFFSPWHQERYFFGWRPIQVSPLGIKDFAGEKALRVLRSEALWVGLPCLLLWLLRSLFSPPPPPPPPTRLADFL